jgi:hypothetical protein
VTHCEGKGIYSSESLSKIHSARLFLKRESHFNFSHVVVNRFPFNAEQRCIFQKVAAWRKGAGPGVTRVKCRWLAQRRGKRRRKKRKRTSRERAVKWLLIHKLHGFLNYSRGERGDKGTRNYTEMHRNPTKLERARAPRRKRIGALWHSHEQLVFSTQPSNKHTHRQQAKCQWQKNTHTNRSFAY